MTISSKVRHAARAMAAFAGLLLAGHSHAVEFTLSGVTGDTWTYSLTYNAFDNYAIGGAPNTATLSLSGLQGVTAASGPTSTDFGPTGGFLDLINLNWTAEVLGGGTEVVWTHIGSGTGNFGIDKHVFGFSVTAPGGIAGMASFVTTGFSTNFPSRFPIPEDRDISIQVEGPIATAIPEPGTWALFLAGLVAVVGFSRRNRRQAD